MWLLQAIPALMLVIMVWLIVSSPFIYVAFYILRILKKRGMVSLKVSCFFGFLFSIIVSPVPSPIITFFAPNIVALINYGYYTEMLIDGSLNKTLIPWVFSSICITSIISSFCAFRFLSCKI